MNQKAYSQVVLIDTEPYLSRLLALKLSDARMVLIPLNPSDLEALGDRPAVASVVSVIVSLPQPGWSDRGLLKRVRFAFPGRPVLSLFPMGHPAVGGDETGAEEHRYFKPLSDVDGFIQVLREARMH